MASGNTNIVVKLVALVVGMFAFAFALVPLYDLLCDVTGLGGRTGGAYTYEPASVTVDASRTVKVNFITNTNEGMVWKFWSETPAVRVHPGDLTEVKFYVRNPTDRVMVAQAIPSLAPGNAAEYFHKTECFCFTRQVLKPGEELEMPMRFLLAPELPKNVRSVSLSYSLFDITELAAADVARAGA
jgi:cytochrome c oxidase assembly protein subunit 11